ncbi:MAG: hypothetical protein HC896_08900 [Bacteroidales bacterium]|nr:hypothetical protein [Bacteroidales bacterium]
MVGGLPLILITSFGVRIWGMGNNPISMVDPNGGKSERRQTISTLKDLGYSGSEARNIWRNGDIGGNTFKTGENNYLVMDYEATNMQKFKAWEHALGNGRLILPWNGLHIHVPNGLGADIMGPPENDIQRVDFPILPGFTGGAVDKTKGIRNTTFHGVAGGASKVAEVGQAALQPKKVPVTTDDTIRSHTSGEVMFLPGDIVMWRVEQ